NRPLGCIKIFKFPFYKDYSTVLSNYILVFGSCYRTPACRYDKSALPAEFSQHLAFNFPEICFSGVGEDRSDFSAFPGLYLFVDIDQLSFRQVMKMPAYSGLSTAGHSYQDYVFGLF